ncbi:hypothetical protein HPB52_024747 [Rhipicephalus sanguineus]|uniref:Uncharacterized protein n=1 Tax=Rhipicephalus sanguineus TaxID=34632 RepID=A0A9D4YRZ7_RHISA|nr:hypothetical protein HPB52_024747 [Rhipicephalus sanguineus]
MQRSYAWLQHPSQSASTTSAGVIRRLQTVRWARRQDLQVDALGVAETSEVLQRLPEAFRGIFERRLPSASTWRQLLRIVDRTTEFLWQRVLPGLRKGAGRSPCRHPTLFTPWETWRYRKGTERLGCGPKFATDIENAANDLTAAYTVKGETLNQYMDNNLKAWDTNKAAMKSSIQSVVDSVKGMTKGFEGDVEQFFKQAKTQARGILVHGVVVSPAGHSHMDDRACVVRLLQEDRVRELESIDKLMSEVGPDLSVDSLIDFEKCPDLGTPPNVMEGATQIFLPFLLLLLGGDHGLIPSADASGCSDPKKVSYEKTLAASMITPREGISNKGLQNIYIWLSRRFGSMILSEDIPEVLKKADKVDEKLVTDLLLGGAGASLLLVLSFLLAVVVPVVGICVLCVRHMQRPEYEEPETEEQAATRVKRSTAFWILIVALA